MKKILLLISIVIVSSAAYSQAKGTITLYGFKQTVSGGEAPDIIEGSSVRTSSKAGSNYYIYAASSSRIYPSEIWVEGIQYGVNIRSITKTPVEYSDETNVGSAKTVLVPKTSKKIIHLIPVALTVNKSIGNKARSLSKANELVVVYKQNGKFFYTALQSLSALESAAMQ